MTARIYHNPRCRKSRAGLEYLKERTSDIEVIDYIKTGLNVNEVENIINLLKIDPSDLIRTQEDIYKKEYKSKNIAGSEWAEIIARNPKLLKRPVVIIDKRAVLGDPSENINQLF